MKQQKNNTKIMNTLWEMELDQKQRFFKCTKWQFEDTLDPINCPFHYFCDSLYVGDYPKIADVLAFFLVTFSYLTTLIAVLKKITSSRRRRREDENEEDDDDKVIKRYLLPSGAISLPLILLILAKGQRINTLFPVSIFGPAILQLVQFSMLVFENNIDKEKAIFVFLEASTISGILHASLYLDAVILPYYTGLDALVTSTLSGACKSCICRKEPLIAGGKIAVYYRGWSSTTFLVIGVLLLRIICKFLCREDYQVKKKKVLLVIKNGVEGLAWIVLVRDCVYLAFIMSTSHVEDDSMILFRVFVFGSLLLLICVYVITQVCCLVSHRRSKKTTNTLTL